MARSALSLSVLSSALKPVIASSARSRSVASSASTFSTSAFSVEEGRHYGPITAKAYAIFTALLLQFHNCRDGRCFPSYKRLAGATGCCERTTAPALLPLRRRDSLASVIDW
jgi:hypothetical protein